MAERVAITEGQARDLCEQLGIDPDAKEWVVVCRGERRLRHQQMLCTVPAWRELQAQLEALAHG